MHRSVHKNPRSLPDLNYGGKYDDPFAELCLLRKHWILGGDDDVDDGGSNDDDDDDVNDDDDNGDGDGGNNGDDGGDDDDGDGYGTMRKKRGNMSFEVKLIAVSSRSKPSTPSCWCEIMDLSIKLNQTTQCHLM